MLYAALKPFAVALMRLFFRLEVVNPALVPATGPVLLVSNHVSVLDPPLIGGAAPRPLSFMAKEELFRIPLFGRLIRALNRIEKKLPRTTLVTTLCHRMRRKLARSGPWVRRCSTMTAGWLAPPLTAPEDVAFLREHVREFNGRFFRLLDDPADAAYFEIRDPQ